MISIYDDVLPGSWEEDELRRITVRKRGYSWAKEDETDRPDETTIPVLRIPNIQDKLELRDLLLLRNVPPDAVRESAVEKGWILFVGSNGNPDRIGDSALITVDQQMVFASFLMGLASKNPDRITPEFLSYWLRLHKVHEIFSKTSQKTTGLANFSWSAVKKLPIRFPISTSEQNAITHVLDTVSHLVTAAKAKLASAIQLKRAFMQQLFTLGIPGRHTRSVHTKAGIVPEEWELVPLGILATIVSGIALNPEREPRFHARRYLTVINVQRERLDLAEVRHMEVFPEELPNALLEADDLVLVEGHANSSEIGRATLVTADAAGFAFQNHLFRIRLRPDAKMNRLFLLGVLNSERIRRHWVATCNTSSGLNTINRRGVRRLLIQRPQLDEQENIAHLLSSANSNIAACNAEVNALELLKRSLLHNLLVGRVRMRV